MNSPQNFANRLIWQLTKRELQETVWSANFWIGLLCIVAVLVISGPFNTVDHLNAFQRLAYWGGISISTYFLALFFMVPVVWIGKDRGWHWPGTSFLAGLLAGIPVGLLVYGINTYVVKFDPPGLYQVARLQVICIIISIAVACLRHIIANYRTSGPLKADPTMPDPFMERLSVEMRGEVLSLQAQDHYVEVTTKRGTELVLMRLRDAIEELSGRQGIGDGMRVHRSWWVAGGAVARLMTENDRLWVKLLDGRQVPVSRANEKPVRAWAKNGFT